MDWWEVGERQNSLVLCLTHNSTSTRAKIYENNHFPRSKRFYGWNVTKLSTYKHSQDALCSEMASPKSDTYLFCSFVHGYYRCQRQILEILVNQTNFCVIFHIIPAIHLKTWNQPAFKIERTIVYFLHFLLCWGLVIESYLKWRHVMNTLASGPSLYSAKSNPS